MTKSPRFISFSLIILLAGLTVYSETPNPPSTNVPSSQLIIEPAEITFYGSPSTELDEAASPESLPPPVIDDQQWKGLRCGVTKPGAHVFRDEKDWNAFWQAAMAPYEKKFRTTPSIDFTKEVVVGVFRGEMPNPVHEIEITSVRRNGNNEALELVVHFRNVDHMLGLATPHVSVRPYHLKKLAVFEGPISFEKTGRK